MGMNPRLLRPLATIHPEAADWANRVRAAGGTTSSSTLKAVDTFCKSIDKNRLRDRFIRVNLFCGDFLACFVPIYRGQSRTGTQYGNMTDTNSGSDLFVAGDYTETGVAGGLKGSSSLTKHLMTGVAHNVMPQNNSHLSVYETQRAGGTFRISIGARLGSNQHQFILATWAGTSNYSFLGYESSTVINLASSIGGHYVGNITGATSSALYRNGGSKTETAATTRTPGSETISVFGLNTAGTIGSRTDARLASYSMGLGFTSDADVLTYSNIMQEFQLALDRKIA